MLHRFLWQQPDANDSIAQFRRKQSDCFHNWNNRNVQSQMLKFSKHIADTEICPEENQKQIMLSSERGGSTVRCFSSRTRVQTSADKTFWQDFGAHLDSSFGAVQNGTRGVFWT